MNADTLIAAKKALAKMQKNLGKELAKGKFKDGDMVTSLKKDIKAQKLKIGDITKAMILQLDVE